MRALPTEDTYPARPRLRFGKDLMILEGVSPFAMPCRAPSTLEGLSPGPYMARSCEEAERLHGLKSTASGDALGNSTAELCH